MNNFIQPLWEQVLQWTQHYGYHAVIPSLLLDPSGVPWGWVTLLLVAEGANLNIPFIIAYGFVVMLANDIILYALGYWGGRALVDRLGNRFPGIANALRQAKNASEGNAIWAVTFGRYFPLIGRWVGAGAGLANVSFMRFLFFEAIGAAISVIGFGLLAHFAGRRLLTESWFPMVFLSLFIVGCVFGIGAFLWSYLARRRNASKLNGSEHS